MADIRYLKAEILEAAAAAILVARGVPVEDARLVAEALVAADLRGIDTHGVACLPDYADALEAGRIAAKPAMTVAHRLPWAATLDAGNGLGPLAAAKGMALVLEAASVYGIGAAAIRRSNHFGAAGVYAARAAADGCVGIVAANASCVAAPHGAKAPLLGTNPLAIAIPAGTRPPLVLDMATSEGSRKKVRKALKEGRTIPAGWALDADGRPTTDPDAALKGVMLPFGGAKGSGLSLIVDVLSGVLSGAEFGGRVLSVTTNTERESGNGHFMLAFKVSAFMTETDFAARMADELSRLAALPPADGFAAVTYPGERSGEKLAKRRAGGIPVPADLLDKLIALGGGTVLSG